MSMKKILPLFLLACLPLLRLEATVDQTITLIENRAQESESDAILILKQGRKIYEYQRCPQLKRIDIQEIIKPILALSLGFFYDERLISSLDTPISTFCPSWEEPACINTSLRALLAEDDDDFFRLAEVVKALSGEEWQNYVQIKLLDPLEIKNACWSTSYDGQIRLSLTAEELAKIGQLIVRKGEYKAKRLLSRTWIRLLQTTPSGVNPFASLQWSIEYYDFTTYWDRHLLDHYRCAGVNHELISRLAQLKGRVVHLGGLAIGGHLIHAWGEDAFDGLGGECGIVELIAETHNHRLPLGYFKPGGIKSIVAWGKGGQQLIIVPDQEVVVVRQTINCANKDTFEDLLEDVDQYILETTRY